MTAHSRYCQLVPASSGEPGRIELRASTGCVAQHRLRLQLSLEHHPLRGQFAPPIACQVLEIVKAEAACHRVAGNSLLLAPWFFITQRIVQVAAAVARCDAEGWQRPTQRSEVAPYASVVAHLAERERWIGRMRQRLDWACDSFALRPPLGTKAHTAALHWSSRLSCTDVGEIPRLSPLSARGPHSNGSIVVLARVLSDSTHVISKARQGEWTMHHYPFAPVGAAPTRRQKGGKRVGSPAALFRGKTCHLCVDGDDGPSYDLWHVLFECMSTMSSRRHGRSA